MLPISCQQINGNQRDPIIYHKIKNSYSWLSNQFYLRKLSQRQHTRNVNNKEIDEIDEKEIQISTYRKYYKFIRSCSARLAQ